MGYNFLGIPGPLVQVDSREWVHHLLLRGNNLTRSSIETFSLLGKSPASSLMFPTEIAFKDERSTSAPAHLPFLLWQEHCCVQIGDMSVVVQVPYSDRLLGSRRCLSVKWESSQLSQGDGQA